MKLHALHGGEVMTIRYSSKYFNFNDTLMATTGLRRTGNPCASSYTFFHGPRNIFIDNDFLQRYESVLENLQWDDVWQVMCATTPGRVQGRNFDGPSSCASWVS